MTADRKVRRLGPRDFREPPAAVAQVSVRGQSWRSPKVRRSIARELEAIRAHRPAAAGKRSELRKTVERYEAHPVHECPDVDDHLAVAARLAETEAEVAKLRRQVRRRKGTIARTFDNVLAVLTALRYVSDWTLTEKGDLLTHVYNEADVLVVECLERGWLGGLDPAELAAVISLFVYEKRGREESESAPTNQLARYERRIIGLHRSIRETERQHGVELVKEPDSGFMGQIYDWASGYHLEDVLADRETSPGDFVRSAKHVVDLLQQLLQVERGTELAETLGEAVERVQRGVVAYSSVV
jgi:ATP-dependent RNA helicase HelY